MGEEKKRKRPEAKEGLEQEGLAELLCQTKRDSCLSKKPCHPLIVLTLGPTPSKRHCDCRISTEHIKHVACWLETAAITVTVKRPGRLRISTAENPPQQHEGP